MSDSVRLRPWQHAALEAFVGRGQPDFLAVATPGAGKTTYALVAARLALARRSAPLPVVAPTAHLKTSGPRPRRGCSCTSIPGGPLPMAACPPTCTAW